MRRWIAIVALVGGLAGASAYLSGSMRGPIWDTSSRLAAQTAAYAGAWFEFAPLDGGVRGLSTACACTNVFGITADGDAGAALVVTRASTAYCTKTTGAAPQAIAVGDMVSCGNNLPRIMPGTSGTTLGLLTESTGTNDFLQSETLCTAPNVNVAACTANSTNSPSGAQTAETMNDTSAGVLQAFTQPITTGSLTRHAYGCYVMAGTASSVTVSITGTGNSAGDCSATATGLSATTYQRVECTSASAYAAGLTAVTTSVGVGTVASDQGTLIVWGCMHELSKGAGDKLSTYAPTTAASVTRAAETDLFGMNTLALDTAGSIAATVTWPSNASSQDVYLYFGGNSRPGYSNGSASGMYDGTNNPLRTRTLTNGTTDRFAFDWGADGGGGMNIYFSDGGITHSAFTGHMTAVASGGTDAGYIGGGGGFLSNVVIKGVVISTTPGGAR